MRIGRQIAKMNLSKLSFCEPNRLTMTAISIIENKAVATAAAPEVLASRLGAEEYGIDILAVQ